MGRTNDSLELVAFAHGMANFGHNRGTKAEQERLLGSRIDPRHGLLGAFEDSGNYAFVSSLGADSVREGVLAALNERYDVGGVVVMGRASCVAALEKVERVAREHYGRRFDRSDYSVHEPSGLWRVGLVFTDCCSPIADVVCRQAEGIARDRLRVLTTGNGIVGVLKYDQGKRIPWGQAAGWVAEGLGDGPPRPLATGRSARTVRGVLRLFGRSDRDPGRPPAAPMTDPAERDPVETAQSSPTTGGPMAGPDRQESFDEIERWLRSHSGLKNAGRTMVDAFVALARGIWEATQGQIVPRKAGKNEQFIPFSPHGTTDNLADTMKFRTDVIKFALKLPANELHRVDPNERTRPLNGQSGRWGPYNSGRTFDLKKPEDVPFLKDLVLACVTKLPKPGVSRVGGTAGHVHRGQPLELDFGFVRSSALREVLSKYWKEARGAYEVKLFTSAAILCGSVVEGMLIDALGRDENQAQRTRVSRSRSNMGSDPVSRWPFDDLIKVASSLQLLSGGTARHCEGLRYTRNLIHPVRAAKDVKEEVTERKAATALATVRQCHEDLETHLRGI